MSTELTDAAKVVPFSKLTDLYRKPSVLTFEKSVNPSDWETPVMTDSFHVDMLGLAVQIRQFGAKKSLGSPN